MQAAQPQKLDSCDLQTTCKQPAATLLRSHLSTAPIPHTQQGLGVWINPLNPKPCLTSPPQHTCEEEGEAHAACNLVRVRVLKRLALCCV